MERIAANSVLPATREPVTLRTGDGLRLVGELASPPAAVATLVCVHPLPTHGGMMDSHLFRKAAWRLPALADIAVLRFNTRGTSSAAGTSEGAFDAGGAEGLDLAAAMDFVRGRGLPEVWLLGWSFGTDVVLRHGLLPGVTGAILLSPPLRFANDDDLQRWAHDGRPLVAMVPEFDDFLPPAEAAPRFSGVPQVQFIAVPGAKHLWVGESYTRIVLDRVATTVTGRTTTLPTEWDGPMSRWSD
ncbi:MAG TPA: alpha/beta hydrolase, partial [Actinomycetota bacterium]|nr:alpha/beta hydrolase [Actinomycetota bacterium]